MLKINRSTPVGDAPIVAAITRELERQKYRIERIASKNIVSSDVLAAQGSVLTNQYAEGLLAASAAEFGCVIVGRG